MDAADRGDRGVGKRLCAAGYVTHLRSYKSALHRQLQTPCLDEQLAKMSGRKGGVERKTEEERGSEIILRHKTETEMWKQERERKERWIEVTKK